MTSQSTGFHFYFRIDIDEESEAWVGAWWLGPLISSVFAVLVALPILGYPERLPGKGRGEIERERESEREREREREREKERERESHLS